MKTRRQLLRDLLAAIPAAALYSYAGARGTAPNARTLPMAPGPFSPSWDSLSQYQTPEWFRDAKFGLWAHWGPQCEPELGDWYARNMYVEGSPAYEHHLKHFGHPSKAGFKDVVARWKAERWEPERLLSLYRSAGARYFVAMANHHDNFDLYDSSYQSNWNSLKLGPRKDLIGGWEKAARNNGLRFGVSVHASHAWTWYEVAQRADKNGPLKGVPYDGHFTRADGKGLWWEGLDPQELYSQQHALSTDSDLPRAWHKQWDWGHGAAVPSQAYIDKFYNRTVELINKYDPDLLYFDDTVLPFWPISDVGLRIAAHMYNRSVARKGKLDAVINGKILNELQRRCMVWDIERGQSNRIEPLPWQTGTCIGSWHYDQRIAAKRTYKSAETVVQMLIDVVSKNGNLLLSVPVRGNGTIDEQEQAIVEEIGRWMAVNSEGLYGSRPWSVVGEGPVMASAAPLSDQGFNEGRNKAFSAEDIRFTTKAGAVFAFVMGWPADGKVRIQSMKRGAQHLARQVISVSLLGGPAALPFTQTDEALVVDLTVPAPSLSYAITLRIS